MEYIQLGKSSLKVSRLAYGCLALGGYGVGDIDFLELQKSVNKAIEIGINFFDTSDIYGLGQSEKLLGKWIKSKRSDVVLSTKYGVRRSNTGEIFYDNSREWLREALDNSLQRLDTDYIDLYFLHHHDGVTPIEEILKNLETEREIGKIRYYGVSNLCIAGDPKILNDYPGLVAEQNEYSLVNKTSIGSRSFDSDKPSLMAFGCLGQGVLSGKYGREAKFDVEDVRSNPKYKNFHGHKLIKNLELLESIRPFLAKYECSHAQIAVRWILDSIKTSVALIGVKNSLQLEQLCHTMKLQITDSDVAELNEISSRYQ